MVSLCPLPDRNLTLSQLGLDVKAKPEEELTETVTIAEDLDEEAQIQEELERLNKEASARAKRERRKNNEKKTRTIQRMQLQMTAPMDIGQELKDASLQNGQGDVFDLKTAEKRRKTLLMQADDSDSEEDDLHENTTEDDEDEDDALNSEEEQEKRVGALEEDLDELYDAYKVKRSERDAKFKVKESRKKNKDREETWGGIRDKKDSEASDSGSSAAGWEEMQERKGDDSESSDEESLSSGRSSDEDLGPRKRKHPPGSRIGDEAPNRKRQKLNNGLITKLTEPAASKTSQIWFSQDIFSGLKDIGPEMEIHEGPSPGSRPLHVSFYPRSSGGVLMKIVTRRTSLKMRMTRDLMLFLLKWTRMGTQPCGM